jgi:hypothetical protein
MLPESAPRLKERITKAPPELSGNARLRSASEYIGAHPKPCALYFLRIIPLYFENSAARRFRLSGIAAAREQDRGSLGR